MRFFLLILIFLGISVPFALAQTQTPENYLKAGKKRMQNKDYKGAILEFSIAYDMESSVEALVLRASAKYMLDDLEGALADYNAAIALDAYDPVIYNNRANVMDEMKKPVDAIKDYDKAISLDSAYTSAYYNRAIARFNLQDYKDALLDFRKVLQKNPQDSEVMLGIALCYLKQNQNNEACEWFNRIKEKHPAMVEGYLRKYCP